MTYGESMDLLKKTVSEMKEKLGLHLYTYISPGYLQVDGHLDIKDMKALIEILEEIVRLHEEHGMLDD